MNKPLMDILLPRLARRLYRHLERYWTGELSDQQFSRRFEKVLHRQHAWLADHGVPGLQAAIGIHAALLVLSYSGLCAEAEEEQIPLEVIEMRAVLEAAHDVAKNYGVNKQRVAENISKLVVSYKT